MTPIARTIAALRMLRRLHRDTGQIPAAELDVLIAELETAPERDAPFEERPDLGRQSKLDLNPHGYPRGLATS